MERLELHRAAGGIDRDAFMALYRGSALENVPAWYPELPEDEGLRTYEDSYWEYMSGPLWEEGGVQALLADETGYRSGLRLYPREGENQWFLEALETRPDCRGRGFGLRALWETIRALEAEGPVRLECHVHKTNAASLATHAAAGFVRTLDYALEDGVRDERQVTLVYVSGGV